jgi:hypothetical protein
MSEQRQKQVLAALLALFALVVAWRSVGTLEGRGSLFGGSGPSIDLDAALRTQVAELDLGRLERGVAQYHAGRNPWRFEAPPPPRIAPPPTPPPRPPVVETPPVDATPSEPPKPMPPQIDVELRGIMGPSRMRIAVFDDGETIYNALEGAVVNDKFRVEKIQIESVLLGYVDFPDTPPARLPIRGG